MSKGIIRWLLAVVLAMSFAPAALMMGGTVATHAAGKPGAAPKGSGKKAHKNATKRATTSTEKISLSRTNAAPGDVVVVTGHGYQPGQTVTLVAQFYANGAPRNVQQTVTVGSNGVLNAQVTVPTDTFPGSYRLAITDAGGRTIQRQLTIFPRIVVQNGTGTSAFVADGHHFFVQGNGFSAGQTVTLAAAFPVRPRGTTNIYHRVTANQNGYFETTLTVPANAQFTDVHVTASAAGGTKSAQVRVVRSAFARPGGGSPTINVSSGSAFYVAGGGFGSNEVVNFNVAIPLLNGSTENASRAVFTDSAGNFGATLVKVPDNVRPGAIAVTAYGQTSKRQVTVTARVASSAALSLSSSTVRPGSPVTVNGTGFPPNSTIQLTVTGNGRTIAGRTVSTNGSGAFSASLTLPSGTAAGTYTVTAVSNQSGLTASARLTAALAPAIVLQPALASPGDTIHVVGAGFTANSTIKISVTFPLYGGGSHTVNVTAVTNGAGSFSAPLTIPGHAAADRVTVTAKGASTSAHATLDLHHVAASISVSPSTANPGSAITIHGYGYPAHDTITVQVTVRLTNGTSQTITTTAHSGGKGDFVKTVYLPSNAAVGTYQVQASSALSGRAPTATFRLALRASLSVSPGTIEPNHTLTITGSGFSANSAITLSATFSLLGGGSKTVTTTTYTNGQGQLRAAIQVPDRAVSGGVTVTAKGAGTSASTSFKVARASASLAVAPVSAIPGSTIHVSGSNYVAGATVDITVSVQTSSGARSLATTATADGNGKFTASLQLPGNASGGSYTVTARSRLSGRSASATLNVARLAPSIVATPVSATPGTRITINGFGFAAGDRVTISLQGQQLTAVTAGSNGAFSTAVTVPSATATGTFALQASSSSGLQAKVNLAVQRQVTTHLYFASIYTGRGYQQYLAFLNPSNTNGRVTITYERTQGAPITKVVTVKAHSRFTENAVTDLGTHVSASAEVTADVPLVAAHTSTHGVDGAIVPAATSPSTRWLFANGNTSGRYREYIAVQNPNHRSVQVAFQILPTHHRATIVYRTLAPTSRYTLKVNKVVKDAVGVIVHSTYPVVANRTIFIRHGVTSKLGVSTGHQNWYFAAGPQTPRAHYWIGAINPQPYAAHVTLHAYAADGLQVATKTGTIPARGRVGYLINRIAHRTDVAVVLTSDRKIVAEQTTYVGRFHNFATDTFGASKPAHAWGFAAVTTSGGLHDVLDLFNPNLAPEPVVVQFITTSGQIVQRTYIVGPLAHKHIDVNSVMPNSELGIIANSNAQFVALNERMITNGQGAMTSIGMDLP